MSQQTDRLSVLPTVLPEFYIPEGVEPYGVAISSDRALIFGQGLLELSDLQVDYFTYLLDNVEKTPFFNPLPFGVAMAEAIRHEINEHAQEEIVLPQNLPRRPIAHYFKTGVVFTDLRHDAQPEPTPAPQPPARPVPPRASGSQPRGASTARPKPKPKFEGPLTALFFSGSGEGRHGWQEEANCSGVDPDLFFPERGASTREAKAVCANCKVRPDCLEYALSNGEKFGIWGGLSERERRRLRRQRAIARRAEQ